MASWLVEAAWGSHTAPTLQVAATRPEQVSMPVERTAIDELRRGFWRQLLISLLPFSVAGWGLRESAMATGFALVHAPAAAAVAASVMFGVLTLLISLPGGLLWWSSRVATPPRSAEGF